MLVELLDGAGNPTGQTTTTANGGLYQFTNLAPGSYQVQFPTTANVNGSTANPTIPNQGTNDAADSDAVNGLSQVVTLASGDNDDTIDAGFVPEEKAEKISGSVTEDIDNNNTGDEPIPGVIIKLLDAASNPILDAAGNAVTATTDNNGFYEFVDVTPGNYILMQVHPEGYISIFDKDDTAEDGDDGAWILDEMINVTVITGEHDADNNFVERFDEGKASIGDFVWEDLDEDGIQDPDEPGIDGVTVMLLDAFGNVIPGIPAQTTANGGQYDFVGLNPGTYQVMFTPPASFAFTTQDANGNVVDGLDSDVDPNSGKTTTITVAAGDDIDDFDAGLRFDSSLPVQLLSFEAQLVSNSLVKLTWSTASEEDNRHFIVERSPDGRDFEPIGVVEGNGTTNLVNHYSLDDLDPYYGYNYYRLKQVDFDGDYEYSHVETVIISGNDLPDVIVYPNPTVNTTTLRVVTPFEKDAQIEIVDRLGRVLDVITMNAGANSKQIDLSRYAAGTYFAYINYNGHRTLVYNIVKVQE